MGKTNFEKYPWETLDQQEYRQKIGQLHNRVAFILGKMPQCLKNFNMYQELYNGLEIEWKLLKNGIKVPGNVTYREIHSYMFDGLHYYLKAFKILIDNTKNADLENTDKQKIAMINKSGKFIEAGNAYLCIATVKSLEYFEAMTREYKRKQEETNNEI